MSAAWDAAFQAIMDHFRAGWVSAPGVPRTPVHYPNAPFTPPDGAAWARLAILPGEGRRMSLGTGQSRLRRWVGVVTVQVFTPFGQGDAGITALTDAAEALFDETRLTASGTLRFGVPTTRVIGKSGSWWQQNMTCPFDRDRAG
jgi:hypothetical protein